jgi:hypothetical protein
MITRFTTPRHPDETAARRAIEALRHAGVPDSAVRLLSGGVLRDVWTETVGGFGGPVGPHARVGTIANTVLQRCGSTGSFAGDRDEQREGSFADNDGVMVVSYEDGTERSRLTGRRGLRRDFRATALDDAAVARADDACAAGTSWCWSRPQRSPHPDRGGMPSWRRTPREPRDLHPRKRSRSVVATIGEVPEVRVVDRDLGGDHDLLLGRRRWVW